ncbi:MAG: hypothetical protein RLZZ156_2554, partial [Deinococcota bacterium]
PNSFSVFIDLIRLIRRNILNLMRKL